MSKYASVEALQCEIQKLCDKNDIKSNVKRLLLRLVSEVPSIEYSAPKALEYSIDTISPKKSFPAPKQKPKADNSIQALPYQNRTRLEIKYKKTIYGYFSWVCEYGHITSQSTKSPERCFQIQMRKLKSNGIDVSTISPEPIIIRNEDNENV